MYKDEYQLLSEEDKIVCTYLVVIDDEDLWSLYDLNQKYARNI